MQLANDIYLWWYWGLGGLGGWSVFFLIAILAAAYVYFHSASKDIKAAGWRLGTLLPMILMIPTIIFRYGNETQPIDPQASEWFLVLGVLGATISVAAAIGYAVTYWGYTPSPEPVAAPPPPSAPMPNPQPAPVSPVAPPKPQRPLAGAWLVDDKGHRYNLYRGDTRIGRRTQGNDIVLNDLSVSREHALIREQDGHFTLFDRGSSSGTYVNNERVLRPTMLYNGDVIMLGEVRLTFVAPER
ncbi:MAG TPA: FHA domain-containing protein [Anaerolineae bacterium]|nr:FHA domain-containing protein [Anaerolineae bacterium]